MQVLFENLSSGFRKMLSALASKGEALNAAYQRAVAEAVKKAYCDAHGPMYVQALIDSTPFDIRPAVVSAVRTFGITINKMEGHGRAYDVPEACVRDKKKQETVLAKIKDMDIPQIIGKADPLPKVKKADTRTAEARAQAAVDSVLKRLGDDPDAKAEFNQRIQSAASVKDAREAGFKDGVQDTMAKFSACLVLEDGSDVLRLTPEEYQAALQAVMECRVTPLVEVEQKAA